MKNTYLPIRITDKNNAEALMKGCVMMPSLSELYLNLNIEDGALTKEDKSIRVFMMNQLYYDIEQDLFSFSEMEDKLDGDMAVIILHPAEFLSRVKQNVGMIFGNHITVGADEDGLYTGFANGIMMTPEYKDDYQAWKIEIGDISDIAMMLSMEALREKKLPESVYSEKIITRLKVTKQPKPGIVSQTFVIFSDFSKIEPTEEWIKRLQDILNDEKWIPITLCEPLSDGSITPILSFQHIDKVQRIIFYKEKMEIIQERKEDEELFLKLMQYILTQITSMILRFACVYRVRLSKITDDQAAYNRRNVFEHNVTINETQYHEYSVLEIARNYKMTIYETAVPERFWYWTEDISTLPNMNCNYTSVEQMRDFYRISFKHTEDMLTNMIEGENPYVYFCSL